MKNKPGKILIVAGFLLAVASPFLVIVLGLPVYITGAIMLLKGEKITDDTIAWLILPVVFWFPAVLILNAFFPF